jgi:hypothetical protein
MILHVTEVRAVPVTADEKPVGAPDATSTAFGAT